jgi:LPPG:FO 2-phospho-L-lactate transferase
MSDALLALAGGVGGAKLALGLTRALPREWLTIVVNTGDDEEFYGLPVSPDLDTVMYTLAGIVNPETGWGLAGDRFEALAMLHRYGEATWFRLGDRDLATHILRRRLLDDGKTLSEVTAELASRLNVHHRIVPMSDAPVRTIVFTNEGRLPFQDYFVRLRCEPVVERLEFEGHETAKPSPAFARALSDSTALVFCPSNPWLSLDPILALPGVRDAIASFRGPRIAVSPIVGGRAIKGPAAKIMSELGLEVSVVGIARYYRGLCDTLVIDYQDEWRKKAVEREGVGVAVRRTVMKTIEDKERLAKECLEIAGLST